MKISEDPRDSMPIMYRRGVEFEEKGRYVYHGIKERLENLSEREQQRRAKTKRFKNLGIILAVINFIAVVGLFAIAVPLTQGNRGLPSGLTLQSYAVLDGGILRVQVTMSFNSQGRSLAGSTTTLGLDPKGTWALPGEQKKVASLASDPGELITVNWIVPGITPEAATIQELDLEITFADRKVLRTLQVEVL